MGRRRGARWRERGERDEDTEYEVSVCRVHLTWSLTVFIPREGI